MQKKKLILHIGLGKTGTTAIQNFCYTHRDFLAQNGLFYPKPLYGESHNEMTYGVQADNPLPLSPEKQVRWYIEEINSSAESIALLSGEFFACDAPELYSQLFVEFDVTVLVYLRNFIHYINAAANQLIKFKYMVDLSQPDSIIAHSELYKNVKKWVAFAGKGHFFVKNYDIIKREDFICDFLRTCGVEVRDFPLHETMNTSLKTDYLFFLYHLSFLPMSEADWFQVVDEVVSLSGRDKHSKAYYLFSNNVLRKYKKEIDEVQTICDELLNSNSFSAIGNVCINTLPHCPYDELDSEKQVKIFNMLSLEKQNIIANYCAVDSEENRQNRLLPPLPHTSVQFSILNIWDQKRKELEAALRKIKFNNKAIYAELGNRLKRVMSTVVRIIEPEELQPMQSVEYILAKNGAAHISVTGLYPIILLPSVQLEAGYLYGMTISGNGPKGDWALYYTTYEVPYHCEDQKIVFSPSNSEYSLLILPHNVVGDTIRLDLPNNIGYYTIENLQIVTTVDTTKECSIMGTTMINDFYSDKQASVVNALQIFSDQQWVSKLPNSNIGTIPLFEDSRVEWAIGQAGGVSGKKCLELGPLEGAHTYMLLNAGAESVTSIEANSNSYLKCLIVKEVFRMDRAKFLFGNFVPWLENNTTHFDYVHASGVLYHMVDPVGLLLSLSRMTDNLFLWTHYADLEAMPRSDPRSIEVENESIVTAHGFTYKTFSRKYSTNPHTNPSFCGGIHTNPVWIEKQTILQVLECNGFSTTIGFDAPDHPNGPSCAIFAKRK